MLRDRATLAFLAGLTAVAVISCFVLIVPFLKPIVFAAVLAIVFYPVQTRALRWTRNRNLAAALSTAFVILLIAAVSFFLGRAITSELRDIYLSLRDPTGAEGRLSLLLVHANEHVARFLGGLFPAYGAHLQAAITGQADRFIASLIAMGAGMLGNLASLLLETVICFFVLFFLFRDGRSVLRRTAAIFPLRPSQIRRLKACVKDTVAAVLYGTLAIAVVQGILAGMAFYFLGFASPVLWGAVTGVCALLPMIGTSFVFVPALLMLAFGGHWIKAVILLLWALAVVHPVDNVLKPYLIGERARLSTLYVFLALLGGVKAFGALGLILGPLILAVTVALLRLLREETRPPAVKSAREIRTPTDGEGASVPPTTVTPGG